MAPSTRTIFDPMRERADKTPARHDETTFDFFDRCGNPVIAVVRETLEEWFARFPAGPDRNDLRGRLRDGDRHQWTGAVWELYVHESLRRMGFAVKPHPRLPASNRRIDFLAVMGADRVYVECSVVTHSDELSAQKSGIGALQAAIDDSGILDYWLDLEFDRLGASPIPPDRFVAGLREWIARQDIDAFDAMSRKGHTWLPSYDWDEAGWIAHVWAIPRSPELRGRPDIRPLGIMAGTDDEKEAWLAMRWKLEAKAEAYGELDAPYVIAVNAPESWPRDAYATWAAYGPYAFDDGWQRDGFLLRPDGPAYPGVSGVLAGVAVQEHSFSRRWPVLHENPNAALPVPASLRWPRLRVDGSAMIPIPGVHPPSLFGVDDEWPGVPWP